MHKDSFLASLRELSLTQADLARLLLVNPRTVGRWVADEESIPGPVERVLKAWLKLKTKGYEWRPNSICFAEKKYYHGWEALIDDLLALAATPEKVIEIVDIRGGPVCKFKVELNFTSGQATFGPIILMFDMVGKSFIPKTFRRKDQDPDIERDFKILEDAFYCIIKEMDRSVLNDRRMD